jgi:hypothetical protein
MKKPRPTWRKPLSSRAAGAGDHDAEPLAPHEMVDLQRMLEQPGNEIADAQAWLDLANDPDELDFDTLVHDELFRDIGEAP